MSYAFVDVFLNNADENVSILSMKQTAVDKNVSVLSMKPTAENHESLTCKI